MEGFFKEDLLERLARLDEDADLLFDDDRRFKLVIVGGSALILLETITRSTHDIDALDVSPEIVDLLEKYDINTRVGTFINNFPYNYDERLVPVRLDGRRIDFYTASLERHCDCKTVFWQSNGYSGYHRSQSIERNRLGSSGTSCDG